MERLTTNSPQYEDVQQLPSKTWTLVVSFRSHYVLGCYYQVPCGEEDWYQSVTHTVCVAHLAHGMTAVVVLHGAPSISPLFRKEMKRDGNAAQVCRAVPGLVRNGISRSSTPTFLLRIWKALAISSAPRGDHGGRDRAIQFPALLNVRGASNVMWK